MASALSMITYVTVKSSQGLLKMKRRKETVITRMTFCPSLAQSGTNPLGHQQRLEKMRVRDFREVNAQLVEDAKVITNELPKAFLF